MLVVDITAADAAGGRLGRYEVFERRQDGSLVLVPETVEEVVAERRMAARRCNAEIF